LSESHNQPEDRSSIEQPSAEQLVQSFLMGGKQSQSGQRRLLLLSKIELLGSLSAAAKALGMSYKGAWQAIEAMNVLAGTPMVVSQKGGSGGGGGMVLSEQGKALVSAYQLFSEQMQHWMRSLEETSPQILSQLELMRKLSMKTSARNLLHGSVKSIQHGAVNSEVVLAIGQGLEVVAQITPSSLERLELQVGSEAFALIKASWVLLADANSGMKTSARNQLCGEVTSMEKGAVNCDVSITLSSGHQMSAIVTNESAQQLGIAVGEPCCALFKASHVLLAVQD